MKIKTDRKEVSERIFQLSSSRAIKLCKRKITEENLIKESVSHRVIELLSYPVIQHRRREMTERIY